MKKFQIGKLVWKLLVRKFIEKLSIVDNKIPNWKTGEKYWIREKLFKKKKSVKYYKPENRWRKLELIKEFWSENDLKTFSWFRFYLHLFSFRFHFVYR